MAAFDFAALDSRGKQQKGVLEADSQRQVRQLLRDKGWTPLSVEQAVQTKSKDGSSSSSGLFSTSPSMSVADLALITRQMATLVDAGIPLEEVLNTVAEQGDKPKIRSMMLGVRSKVLEGHSLAISLAEFPVAFPQLYRSTVAAGEQAGHLGPVMDRLADYTESQQQARQKIQMAMIYPVILIIMSVAIVVGLLTFVVPDIVKVFDSTGQELPPLTQALLASSEFLQDYGFYLLLGIIALVIAWRYALSQPDLKKKVHFQLLHLPFISKLSRGVNTARFASTLSILTSSGLPLVDAMKVAGEVLSNVYLKDKIGEATQRVSEGSSLRVSLDQTGYFPPMMLHMIASGESSGELDSMLERTANNQQRALEAQVTSLVSLFEPLMILFMGAMVLLIVLAILLPILNLNQLVG